MITAKAMASSSSRAQPPGSAAVLLAALPFGWNIHRTLATPSEPYESYLRAGCAWLVVATGLGFAAAMTGKTTLQSVM